MPASRVGVPAVKCDGIVSCAPGSTHTEIPMPIVVIAWLFVVTLMAATLASPLAGVAWFAGAGVAPVMFLAWLLARRRRRRSMLQEDVKAADDRDAKPDR
jgi:membrane protein implicated in regulation of membrane protease activity